MRIRATSYKVRALGIMLTLLRDSHNRPHGVALYVNLILIGFGLDAQVQLPEKKGLL